MIMKKTKAYSEKSRPELKPKQLKMTDEKAKDMYLKPNSSEKNTAKNLLSSKPLTSELHQGEDITSEESDDDSKTKV